MKRKKEFGGLRCSNCGGSLSLSVGFDGMSERARRHGNGESWDYEIALVCRECGRAFPICRTNDENNISALRYEND